MVSKQAQLPNKDWNKDFIVEESRSKYCLHKLHV